MGRYASEVVEGLSEENKKKALKKVSFDEAKVFGYYEAQNNFGVYLKGSYLVKFKKYEDSYCGGECDWKYDSKAIK